MPGGNLRVSAGAVAISSGVVVLSGAAIISGPTATLSGVSVLSGESIVLLAGGTAIATTLDSGGTAVVLSGGTASSTTISSGGVQDVRDVGVATAATVYGGGEQIVEVIETGPATAIRTVLSGGSEIIASGGIAWVTTAFAGATQSIGSGGVAGGTMLSGGSEIVSAGGIADRTVIYAGSETVLSGGNAAATLIAGPGALLDLQVGAAVSGGVSFFGIGGRLEIDDTASPNFTVSGLRPDDAIDLANVPFDSAGTAALGSGNVLLITESGGTISLQLDPGQDFTGHSFALAPDAGGGTLVEEPTGGRFLIGPASGSGLSAGTIGINDGTDPTFPQPVSGNLNTEIFTALPLGMLPGLDPGFQAGIIDNAAYITSAGYLTGTQLQLFGGDYLLVDAATGDNTPAEIMLGSGSQQAAGAPGDTLVGGSGNATLYGAAGDSIAFGSVGQYADGTRGSMTIALGTGGVDSIVGSTVAGGGDTITGGAAALDYNVGSGGDLLDLAGSTGNSTINAFLTGGNDTVATGLGAYSVWGGDGDRIAVGDGPTVGGVDLWGHSTTVSGAAIGFGTNDSVVATTYDTVGGAFSINSSLPGASAAQVTLGGGAGNFDPARDYLFYPNETPSTDAAIVATAQSADGGASSVIALPDGTVMRLTGITQAQLQSALLTGTLFSA